MNRDQKMGANQPINIDTKLEKQLADLAEEVSGKGPGAIFAVLQILRNSYVTGKHNEFATHCCTFSQTEGAVLSTTSAKVTEEVPDRYVN